MRLFQTATCFLKVKKSLTCRDMGLSRFLVWFAFASFCFYLLNSLALGSSFTMTRRDSSFAGLTRPSSSMNKSRRVSWRSRSHGQSSSTAAPSDLMQPPRGDNDSQAGSFLSPHASGEYTTNYGYSSANLATPIPSPADHQAPILPTPTGESYPLQQEMEEVRRQLHAYYFVEVQSPPEDDDQPALRRLMVTEVDRRGRHHNRQPEYFFNGIIGHVRFVPDRMAGLIHGINPPSSPTTGDATFRSPRSLHMVTGVPIKLTVQRALHRHMNPSWMTQILSLPMLTSIHLLSRFINWQRSSGTSSTMTGRPTWPYSNVWRILKEIFPDTQFRSSRRQTWLILLATWRNPPGPCLSKHDAWRPYLMTACEF